MVEHYYVARHNENVLLQKSNLPLFIQLAERNLCAGQAAIQQCGGDKLGIILN